MLRTVINSILLKMLGDLVTERDCPAPSGKIKAQRVGTLEGCGRSKRLDSSGAGKILGVAQGTVSKIMTGVRSITVDHAKRVARHFKMAPEAFLDLR